MLFLVSLQVSCGDDLTAPGLPGDAGEVEAFFAGLPSWESLYPVEESSDAPIPDLGGNPQDSTFRALLDGVTYECTTTPYRITETPDKIVTFDPDASILWLGALLQGRGYAAGVGSLRELPIRERAPLTITVDLLTGDNTRTVENPTLASVNAAIGDMIRSADRDDLRAGSSISFSQENTHSVRQAALALGLSAAYMSNSVEASLAASRSVAERTITAYFVQRMFTASVVLPQSPTDFFSSDLTQERLEEQQAAGNIGLDNLPVYVANIVYGRILKFSFTSTAREDSIRAAISASFGQVGGGELSASLTNILNEARINVVAIGGEGKNALALIQTGELQSYFETDAALTSARPISYTVRNLGDNRIAKVSETTDYTLQECTPLPRTGALEIDISPNDGTLRISGPGGFADTSSGDYFRDNLQAGGYRITLTDGSSSKSTDTTVVAGETTSIQLGLTDAVGAVYRVRFVNFELFTLPSQCVGSLDDPDVYYAFRANGSLVVQRDQANAIDGAQEGQVISLDRTSGEMTLSLGGQIRVTGDVHDDDGFANEPDRIGRLSETFTVPATSEALLSAPAITPQRYPIGVNGCEIDIRVEFQKVRAVF